MVFICLACWRQIDEMPTVDYANGVDVSNGDLHAEMSRMKTE